MAKQAKITPEVQLRMFWFFVAALAIAIAWSMIRRARRQSEMKSRIPHGEAPSMPAPGREYEPGRQQAWNACNVAEGIRAEMKGITISSQFLDRLNDLTDTQLVEVYNCFNERFYEEGHGTLRNWVDDEWLSFWNFGKRNTLRRRFDRLNLE